MSSAPVRATSMAMSPMWLTCDHWSISPNPMASLRFREVGLGVTVCGVRALTISIGPLSWEGMACRGKVRCLCHVVGVGGTYGECEWHN